MRHMKQCQNVGVSIDVCLLTHRVTNLVNLVSVSREALRISSAAWSKKIKCPGLTRTETVSCCGEVRKGARMR